MRNSIPDAPGVYCIVNTVTNEEYIGQSVSMRNRWSNHRSELQRGRHSNWRLQQAWDKFGEATFHPIVLRELPANVSHYALELAEAMYIIDRQPAYNLTIEPRSVALDDQEVERRIAADAVDRQYITLQHARAILGVSQTALSRMIREKTLEVIDDPLDRRRKYLPFHQVVSLLAQARRIHP